jgi:hypothetical protein
MNEVKCGLRQFVGQEVMALHLDPITLELVEKAGVEIQRNDRARAPDPLGKNPRDRTPSRADV